MGIAVVEKVQGDWHSGKLLKTIFSYFGHFFG